MIGLTLSVAQPTILCLGAHSDDIEIGAGATLLQLLEGSPGAEVHWRVFSAEGVREEEARRSARLFAGDRLASIEVFAFRDGFFPAAFADIKERVRETAASLNPDLIFTHWRGDLHQDHRLIADLTGQTFRDHLILQYEILKYDGDLGAPNLYVPVGAGAADRKVAHLLEAFASQQDKYWFKTETFAALMRVRGVESRTEYAEAFYTDKTTVRFEKA